jgi:hypothetical protein
MMHPMFVKLFLENDADDLLADEQAKRRSAARAKRSHARTAVRVTVRERDRQQRR